MGARHAHAFTAVLGPEQVALACRDDRDVARLAALGLPQSLQTVPYGPGLASAFTLAVVATQTEHHFAVAQTLALPLLVEKPLCQSPEQARALLGRPQRTFVGHSSRMEAGAAPFHQLIRAPAMGTVRQYTVAVVEPRLCRGEAPLPMVASRIFDVLVHAMARIADLLPNGPPHYTVGTLADGWSGAPALRGEVGWPGGPVLNVDVRSDGAESCATRAISEAGSARWDLAPGSTAVGFRKVQEADYTRAAVGGPEPQLAAARELVRALAGGEPSPLDAVYGLRVMELAGAVVSEAVRSVGAQWDWTWVK